MAGCLAMQCVPVLASEQGSQNSANVQDTQAAFESYLNRIYAEWISENPFDVHFYLEHPEDYGIELREYTLLDYSEYDDLFKSRYTGWRSGCFV